MAVYASTDWHGCLDPAAKLLDFLKPDDTLYYIGDAIDRGNHGFELLNTLLDDKRVKFIAGNHEIMMVDTLYQILNIDRLDPYFEDDIYATLYNSHWFMNGGEPTWYDGLKKYSIHQIKDLIRKIEGLPSKYIYKSSKGHKVILEHAGCSPFDIPHRSHDPYWDRGHFHDDWDGGCGEKGEAEKTYLVHGHTPVQYLKFMYGYKDQPQFTKEDHLIKYKWGDMGTDYKPEVIRYCDGHKFDIDLCTIANGRIALLNLDTFETIYFDGKLEKEKKFYD